MGNRVAKYYLAIDIGASSGRHILGHVEDDIIITEEVFRFSNELKKTNGSLCWDLEDLFQNILEGLACCNNLGKIPETVAIDTWACDFVLLDKHDKIIGDTVGYRDNRTLGMDTVLSEIISEKDLYIRTGIQKQLFNTIYQLLSIKERTPEYLTRAKNFLMIPDYLSYRLSGVMRNEYTVMTSTQLISPITKKLDTELLKKIGIDHSIFQEIVKPSTLLGLLKEDIALSLGFQTKVITTASHDTAAAVVAVPSNDQNILYISSGTWSLLGTEKLNPILTESSRAANFTNEGGYEDRFRFLKNIMGLWMIQSLYNELDCKYNFETLCAMAESSGIKSIINCNDPVFLSPESMIMEVKNYCSRSAQTVPVTVEDLSAVIYNSLGISYKEAITEIETITGQRYKTLNIIGGGANAEYLNQLTADYTGLNVITGPVEATAIGNLMVQMIKDRVFKSLRDGRECILKSFKMKIYKPKEAAK